jgi:TonB family protein
MKRELFFSLLFHVVVVGAAMVSSPFDPRDGIDYGDVIRVSLPSAADIAHLTRPPVAIPQAVAEEPEEIPIQSPSTRPAAEIEAPQPKPQVEETPPVTENHQAAAESSEIDLSSAGGAASPFAGARVDNASFNYPFWFKLAFDKISRNWRNPVAYDGTLVCVIYFQVIKSGRVIELKVVESSGLEAFDKVCLAAIERSEPFPPLPREFRQEIIGITLPVKWEPR